MAAENKWGVKGKLQQNPTSQKSCEFRELLCDCFRRTKCLLIPWGSWLSFLICCWDEEPGKSTENGVQRGKE